MRFASIPSCIKPCSPLLPSTTLATLQLTFATLQLTFAVRCLQPRALIDVERQEAYRLLMMKPLELPPPKLHKCAVDTKAPASEKKALESSAEKKLDLKV